MLRLSPSIIASLESVTAKQTWCSTVIAALGSSRRVICKTAGTSTDVWGTGTTFLDIALTGPMAVVGYQIHNLGVMSSVLTQTDSNLASGFSVLRIQGATPDVWIEGSLGLPGSGANFILRANLSALGMGVGFNVGAVIKPPATLPDLPEGSNIVPLYLAPERNDTSVPLTFGQPIILGDVDPEIFDLKVFDGETQLVSQADELTFHGDGSVRFAVMSAIVPAIANGVQKELTVRTVAKSPQIPAVLTLPGDWQFNAIATVYRHQLTAVRFTDRATGGYVVGETVQLSFSGVGAVETYTVTIKSSGTYGNQTGAGFQAGMNIAVEFAKLMENSTSYRVFQSNYERLFVRARDPSAGVITITSTYAGTAVISQLDFFTYGGPPQDWTVDFHSALAAKIALVNAGTPTTGVRMLGPAAAEFELVAPFMFEGSPHPHLEARLMVRMYAGGAHIRSDLTMEACRLQTPNQRQLTYGLVIRNGTTVRHTEPSFTHFYAARWHKVTWHGTNPEVHFKHHVPYFLDTKAVLNYDRDNVINETAIASNYAALNEKRLEQAHLGPMAYLLWRPGMGDTGGRPDIGPSPMWFVLHLMAQDKRTKELMLAQSDAAGMWGAHFRDETTGYVVRIDDYPNISVNTNYVSTPGMQVRGLNPGELDPTGVGHDLEHQADMAYIPYLITGDYYYMEECHFWGGYCPASFPADYRTQAQGLVNRTTLRAQAWCLKNMSNAERITPPGHPLKSYFEGLVNRNFAFYAQKYVAGNPDISPLGAMEHPGTGQSAPWQMDFMASTMCLNADNGNADAQTVVNWMAQFVVGRVTSPDYCINQAAGYYWEMKYEGSNEWIDNWADLYARNEPASVGVTCSTIPVNSYPGTSSASNAYLLGMVAAMYNSGVSAGLVGYNNYKPLANLVNAFKNDPTWSVVPRLS